MVVNSHRTNYLDGARGEQRQKVCRVWPEAQRLLLQGDFPGARSAMADTSMIPSPAWPAAHAAASHPWATSSPSVETRVLSTTANLIFRREEFFGVWGQKPILNDGEEGGWYALVGI